MKPGGFHTRRGENNIRNDKLILKAADEYIINRMCLFRYLIYRYCAIKEACLYCTVSIII